MLLTLAGQKFVDHQVSFKEWETFKQGRISSQLWQILTFVEMPFGKVPVLEVDGKLLPQLLAILRYLSKEHGE